MLYCPLKFVLWEKNSYGIEPPDGCDCDREQCAWWIEKEGSCVIRNIAACIGEFLNLNYII